MDEIFLLCLETLAEDEDEKKDPMVEKANAALHAAFPAHSSEPYVTVKKPMPHEEFLEKVLHLSPHSPVRTPETLPELGQVPAKRGVDNVGQNETAKKKRKTMANFPSAQAGEQEQVSFDFDFDFKTSVQDEVDLWIAGVLESVPSTPIQCDSTCIAESPPSALSFSPSLSVLEQ